MDTRTPYERGMDKAIYHIVAECDEALLMLRNHCRMCNTNALGFEARCQVLDVCNVKRAISVLEKMKARVEG